MTMTVDKKTKAAKSHHVPTRMCLACGVKTAPFNLSRYFRDEAGTLQLDAKRNKGRRGAYVCKSKGCFEKAVSKRLFNRALRGNVVCGGQRGLDGSEYTEF